MFGLFALLICSIVIATAIVILFNQKTLAAAAGVLVFVFGVFLQSFTVISAGHTGVQVTLGEVNPVPLTEGVHFVNPISVVRDIDVRMQKATADSQTAGTKDLQQVHTDIVINYRMSPTNLPHIYKEFGLDVDAKILGPAINDAFKAVTGKYDSSELITKRDEVSQAILIHLREKVAPFNIDVSNVSLVNFGFSAEYQKAIEQKVIATQQTAKAEQDLKRIEVEARSRIAQAEGEAKAIAIQAQAIQSNGGQNYVQLEWIKRWNGKLPETVVNGSTGMMLNMGK
jgi:prohibitin 2